jgi:hypothetical protein
MELRAPFGEAHHCLEWIGSAPASPSFPGWRQIADAALITWNSAMMIAT